MKTETETERMSWHERLSVMNLMLPVLEIAVVAELVSLIGSLVKLVIGLLSQQRSSG